MIDIHSHILPMVDDGSQSVEESLEMLAQAYEDGTDAIILTPHLSYAYGFINPKEKIKGLFEQLKNIVEYEGIPIDLYLGCEYHFSSRENLRHHFDDITKLNNTRYLLMEYYFDVNGEEIIESIDMIRRRGCIPVIAHPERFEAIQVDLNIARRAWRHGALLQMNKGSILGDYGQSSYETAMALLDLHYIDFVGSDAHNLSSRHPRMSRAYMAVADVFGENYAQRIFEINPALLLRGQSIK